MTLVRKRCSKNIIVAPASTLYQWKEEYERWTNQPFIILARTTKKVDAGATIMFLEHLFLTNVIRKR